MILIMIHSNTNHDNNIINVDNNIDVAPAGGCPRARRRPRAGGCPR